MRRAIVLLAAVLTAVPFPVFAQSFKILGVRPMSMGGAHVAAAEGAIAQYWNPAGLAVSKSFEVTASIGAGLEVTRDLLKEADELADLADKMDAIQAKTDSSTLSLAEYQDFLNALVQVNDLNKDGLGLLAEIQGGGGVRAGRFALTTNTFFEMGADPFVDTVNMGLDGGSFGAGVNAAADFNGGGIGGNTNTGVTTEAQLTAIIQDMDTRLGIELPTSAANVANELIAQALSTGQTAAQVDAAVAQISQLYTQAQTFLPSGLNPFAANQTNLTIRGAAVTELALGYGGGIPIVGGLPLLNRISVGANLKHMRADVGYATLNLLDDQGNDSVEVDDFKDEYRDSVRSSTAMGLDVGALLDLKDTFLRSRAGLVVRNINRPSFDQPEAAKRLAGLDKYTLDAQARLGWAWYPLSWVVVAADVDATENSTPLPGYKSRMAGGGVELNVFNRSWLNLALRGGALKNIAESDAAMAYTGGFGLNLLHFYLDLGGAVSPKTVKTDTGDEIPSSVRFAASIGLRF